MTDEASSLTVAKLKALCVINDLPTTGKKAVLVERLLESGLSRKEVGLKDVDPVEEAEEEVVFSLEDETTIAPTPKPKPKAKPVAKEDDVLDAVILDADLVFDEPEEVEEEPEEEEKRLIGFAHAFTSLLFYRTITYTGTAGI